MNNKYLRSRMYRIFLSLFTKLMTVIFKKDGGQRHLLQWSSKSLETAPTFVSHNWKNNINR